jgi:ATP-binding cassette subfamily B protein
VKSQTKQTLKIYWQHAVRYPWLGFFILVMVVLGATNEIFKPFLYKKLFDLLALQNTSLAPQMIQVVVWILFLSIFYTLLWRGIGFSINYFQPRVMSDLLNTCYKYLQNHSYSYFNNNFVGSLVTRVQRYQRAFENVTDQIFFEFGRTTIITAGILTVLFYRYWILGLILLVWSVVYVVIIYLFTQYKIKYDLEKAAVDTKTTGYLADTISNNINVKLFTSYDAEYNGFKKLTDKLFKLRKFTWDLNQTVEGIQGVLALILEFSVMYVAVRYWQKGLITVGDFALLQAYVFTMFEQLWGIGRQMRSLYENIADANEMTEVLITPHGVVDVENAKKLKVINGGIVFDQVNFYYRENKYIFKKFDLTIKPGERVALIGQSGGGKSTIVKLLLRFMDIQNGKIFVDGQDISQVTQDSLRKAMSLVPQDPILFHRSLFENIRYAKPSATKEEVIKAAKLAHCHEFITTFPEKYDTLVGERGVKLSGGERQRVAIARAILKNAPILILDEATSSLDSESESFIQDALKVLMKDKTTIVIAHRLSTIMQMDRIIVLENGKVTEQGRHDELVKAKQGTYQKLWEIQAGGFH